MGSLERKIKKTEAKITIETAYIEQQLNQLKGNIADSVLLISVLSSFSIGFLVSRNKTPSQLIKSIISYSRTGQKFYNKIKLFLPII